ncbi:MAG TPA: hypothetical protein VGL56_02850 [Fimbriimonadaceae bacterium]|jgi:hypothetical protein
MRPSSICLLALLIASGCKPSDQVITGHQTVSAELPAGWTRLASDTAPVSIGLPPDWHKKTARGSEIKAGLSQIKSNNAADDNLKSSGDEATQTIKLFFDHGLNKSRNFDINGNIVVAPSQGASLDQVTKANTDQIAALGAKNITAKSETLTAGDSRVFAYSRNIDLPSGSVDLDFMSYFLVESGNVYVITFALPAGDSTLKNEADQMAQTFKIGG